MKFMTTQKPPGGGERVLPYISSMGTCRCHCAGYGVWPVNFGIEYRNQTDLV